MSPITKTERTQNELQEENQAVEVRKKDAVNAVLSSLDLPTDEQLQDQISKPPTKGQRNDQEQAEVERLMKIPEDKLTPAQKMAKAEILKHEGKKPEKEPEKKSDKDAEEELTAKELLETPDEELTDEGVKIKRQLEKESQDTDEDDELIPKSKIKKRIGALTKQIKDLQSRLDAKEAQDTTDKDAVRLAKKTPEELKSLRRTVRSKIRTETDEDKIQAYYDLEDKIDEAIVSYPQRFHERQVSLYDAVAAGIEDDPEITLTKDVVKELKDRTAWIYKNYPKLQQLEEGQAMALRFALDYHKATSKVTAGKPRDPKLRTFAARLKKRTTLDSNRVNRSKGATNVTRLRDAAHGKRATSLDKAAWVKEDPKFGIDQLIPEEFKGR